MLLLAQAPVDELYVRKLLPPFKSNVTANLCCLGISSFSQIAYSTLVCVDASHSSVPVVDIPFPDGKTPDKESIKKWLDVVVEVYGPPAKQKKEFGKKETPDDAPAIAVHCIAGLGRSPLLVAIALIEYGYGKPLEVIQYIRSKRRNAINGPQMEFLKKYKRTLKSSCILM